jgi:hypothetical protein
MKISEAKNRFLFKTRIPLYEEYEDYEKLLRDIKDNPEMKIDIGDDWVDIREPNIKELQEIQKTDEGELFNTMYKLIEQFIIASSIENDDGTPAKIKDVANIIRESSSMFSGILNIWTQTLPFNSRQEKQQKSDNAQS